MAVVEAANHHLKELDRLRKEQDAVIRKINKIHLKLSQTAPETAEKFGEKLWIKLRGFYVEAKTLAEAEENVSSLCVGRLDSLITPGQVPPHRKKLAVNMTGAGEQKRKRIKTEADSSRLCSPTLPRTPVSHSSILPGDQVAARVTADDSENHEWIVVKVTRFDRDANKYEVIDEEPDDDAETDQRKYKLPSSCIIPLPKRTEAANVPDFPPGSQVLAVYPGTTALYKAAVVGPHRKKRSDDFLLEFDGDEEEGVEGLPKRPVPFHHVVQLPEGHRQ